MKNRIISVLFYLVFFFAAWNLIDYIYQTAIVKSAYQFPSADVIAIQIVTGVIVGYFLVWRRHKSDDTD